MRTRRLKRRGIIKRFGQWAVTQFGVENLSGPCSYEIDKSTLGHPWWSDHMGEKRWVNRSDFDRALQFAREHFKIKMGTDVLW